MIDIFYPKQLLDTRQRRIENQCFFAMPFSPEYTNLCDTLSFYLEKSNYIPLRGDKNSEASVPIITLILTGIATSQYIIVDISEPNANVFYELGIAQTLKEPGCIFIIKEKHAKMPFDIQHLQFIEYNKDNLKELAEKLIKKLQACQYKNDFWNALNSNNFIDYKQIDLFADFCIKKFKEQNIKIYTDILNSTNDIYPMNDSMRNAIWDIDDILKKETYSFESVNYIPMLELFLIKLLLPCCRDAEIVNFVEEFLTLTVYGSLHFEQLISFQTDMVIELATYSKLENIALNWIIDYFQRSKSTKIDLNRYKLESFLLKKDSIIVNEYIINAIVSENHYIREHMSDIAGEKKLKYAETNLIIQLKREQNIYTMASIIEALGKIDSSNGAQAIYDCIEDNAKHLLQNENYFVLKHARNAIKNLHDKKLLHEFDDKYLQVLKNNNIL